MAINQTILFVCSQGQIRSRTAEVVAIRGGIDARSCGTDQDAPVPINDSLIRLADVIVCMEEHHATIAREYMHAENKRIYVLGIEDIYEPFTPRLITVLEAKLREVLPDVARALKNAMCREIISTPEWK